jgi:hypothetical protein
VFVHLSAILYEFFENHSSSFELYSNLGPLLNCKDFCACEDAV